MTLDIFNSATLSNGHRKVAYEDLAGKLRSFPERRSLRNHLVDYYVEKVNDHTYQVFTRFKLPAYALAIFVNVVVGFFWCLWNEGLREYFTDFGERLFPRRERLKVTYGGLGTDDATQRVLAVFAGLSL